MKIQFNTATFHLLAGKYCDEYSVTFENSGLVTVRNIHNETVFIQGFTGDATLYAATDILEAALLKTA